MNGISSVSSVSVSSLMPVAIPQQLIQTAKSLGINTSQYTTVAQLSAAIQAARGKSATSSAQPSR